MASAHYNIMTQALSALNNITVAGGYNSDVGSVSTVIKHWEQVDKGDMPALFPIAMEEPSKGFAIGEVGNNQEVELTLTVTGFVYDTDPEARRLAFENLIQDVKVAIINHTALSALILMIDEVSTMRDNGTIPDYNVFDVDFNIQYIYNFETGG